MNSFIISKQLGVIADELQHTADATRVAIRPGPQRRITILQESNTWADCIHRHILWIASQIGALFGKTIPYSILAPDDISTTLSYLQHIFGAKRLQRLDKALSFNLSAKEGSREYFTRKDVAKIFAGAEEVTWEDMQELFQEIKTPSAAIRYLTIIESDVLRNTFRDAATLDGCCKRQYDMLKRLLAPFAKIEHAFLHSMPVAHPVMESTLTEKKLRCLTYHALRHYHADAPHFSFLVAKELAGRALPKGVLIPHHYGYFENMRCIEGGGEQKYLLKNHGSPWVPSAVLYRGTNPGNPASLAALIAQHIGEDGIKVNFEETLRYLTSPALGFVRKSDEPLMAIGFSQGGCHASLWSHLLPHRFRHIVTICAPGIERNKALEYAQRVEGLNIKIDHIGEPDDDIDQFGEAHLGVNTSIRNVEVSIHIAHPGAGRRAIIHRLPCPKSIGAALGRILFGYPASHCRPALGRSLIFTKLSTADATQAPLVERFLSHDGAFRDQMWERYRKIFAAAMRRVLFEWQTSVKNAYTGLLELGELMMQGAEEARPA